MQRAEKGFFPATTVLRDECSLLFSEMASSQPSSSSSSSSATSSVVPDPRRAQAIVNHKKKAIEHRLLEVRVKKLREDVAAQERKFNKTEDDLKAVQNVGQIIGEVLKQLDEERSMYSLSLLSLLHSSLFIFFSCLFSFFLPFSFFHHHGSNRESLFRASLCSWLSKKS